MTHPETTSGPKDQDPGGYPYIDWRQPPPGGVDTKYTARYHKIVRGNKSGNVWWDLVTMADTPEEVHELMARRHPEEKLYVVYEVTATELIVDTSRMQYEPGDPYYGVGQQS